MDDFNQISYLEEELRELDYLELRARPLSMKGQWIPYNLFNGILHTKINITQIIGGIINELP